MMLGHDEDDEDNDDDDYDYDVVKRVFVVLMFAAAGVAATAAYGVVSN